MKKHTKVLLSDIPKGTKFGNHAFFHGVPHIALRELEVTHLFEELGALEKEVATVLEDQSVVLESHKYGANMGVNLGLSVVDGGTCHTLNTFQVPMSLNLSVASPFSMILEHQVLKLISESLFPRLRWVVSSLNP